MHGRWLPPTIHLNPHHTELIVLLGDVYVGINDSERSKGMLTAQRPHTSVMCDTFLVSMCSLLDHLTDDA